MLNLLPRWLMLVVLLGSAPFAQADDSLLVHWKFDEGQGKVTADAAGQSLSGQTTAGWVASPLGSAALLDGTPATVVKTTLPPQKRLGKGSWTVMAWVKPQQFSIDSPQNQRRLFAYGAYPQAFFCVDIFSTGAVSLYEIYDAAGKKISTGVTSSTGLTLNQWAHVAVVCDRPSRLISIYINGRLRGEQKLPPEFDADLSVNGEFTLGNGWQNYWGAADEVRLYNRALSKSEVNALVAPLKTAFNVVPTAAEAAADALEAMQQGFSDANAAWAKKDFTAARQRLIAIVTNSHAPAHYRSYAHLRIAQSYVAQGQPTQARTEYEKIAAMADYPAVHRDEAADLAHELSRAARGLPPRDPAATRVTTPPRPKLRHRLFVAPSGSDANPGTEKQPLASLIQARDRARPIYADGGVEIILAPGEYPVTQTLALDGRDSGTATAPVVYRAQQPGTATLYGGVRLSGFTPVTDPAILARLPLEARGKVLQLDLKAHGLTDYGALAVRGFGQPPSPPTLELYVNQQPMTLARWPNEGFVKPTKLVEPGSKAEGKPSVLAYDDERPARWTGAKDAWIFGYFHFLWADATAKIAKIDTAAKTITTAQAYDYGGGMSNEQGIMYYVFNLLEEIDRPGEWYLDRDTGILYLYPPGDLSKATVELSLLSQPMITGTGLSNVRFEGLVFDLARGDGIVLKDSNNCLLAGCTVKRMAGNGISILGGSRDMLLSCDVHTIGRRATEVIGGDRATLTPGGHVVANCRIHNFGRIDRTYTPGIQLEGVGNHVTHNLFYDSPSSVMRIEGNDHLIEYNEVHDAVLESDDQGAMELFANPTYRGVVFRHNLFERIGIPPAKQVVHGPAGQAAIRFDDAISGMLVYGNIFYRAAGGNFGGVQMNSGRDNIMDNNLFVECAQGISGGYYPNNNVWKQLRAGEKIPGVYTNDLYVKRYPLIATMLDEPAVNHVWRNVFYKCVRDFNGNR
ncbi:MAG: right-handed parallel beta-helix repeat-containing protein, partial [Abitibacteriaceae bacterium]|nr:right-handed parallel beta-helix repeat-containing protein [Abditibacteriaceae bacterium]